MRRLAAILALGVLCVGCASVRGAGDEPDAAPGARWLARANELAAEGRTMEARDLYEQIVRKPSRDAVHAAALYELARLYVDPSGGFLDYQAAQDAFERLLADYPEGRWHAEARAWRATLLEVRALETDAARRIDEVVRLKAELWSREVDVARLKDGTAKLKVEAARLRDEAARLRDETAKLKADLQRLKQIDLRLERAR